MGQIAIDGPAGAGKSTIAKEVSKRLDFMYVDTGAMYRTIALACVNDGADIENEADVSGCCTGADIDIRYENGVQHMYLKGKDVSREIRQEQIGRAASVVSKYPAVRERLVKLQQDIGSRYDVVMDGRDIGTKVLVDADLKIYLTASPDCRARRRFDELKEKGEICDLEAVKQDIIERDRADMTREISPLCKAKDAVEVDTSEMTIEEVTGTIISLYNKRSC